MFDELIIKRNKDNTYSMIINGFKDDSLKNKKAQVLVPIMRNVELEISKEVDQVTMSRFMPVTIPSYNINFALKSNVGLTKSGLAYKIDTRKVRPTKIKRTR